MTNYLSEKFQRFNGSLNEAEKANFKLLLGLAAGGLAPGFAKPKQGLEAVSFDTVAETLARMQPYSKRIPRNGIAYRGRPAFMTPDLLADLQEEARTLRPSAKRFEEHFLGCGAPLANELAVSQQLVSFVREYAGEVEPTGIASFLYYDEPGQGIDPHIDTEIFSLNVLLMLEHNYSDQLAQSALIVFPPFGEPERLDLVPGEVVVMFAGSVAHGREAMKDCESVSILTFGFHPLGT
jgi:hypothetical protein